MISPPRGRFLLHVVVVVLVPSPGNGQLHPKNPTIYKMVSLNQNCGTRFGNGSLNNATEPLSSAIVTATQFRDRRAATTDGCSTEIGASSSESMIVSLVEMNLRQGLLNDSCIDYVNIITRFTSANDPDQQCGRIRESENKAFSTSYTLSIKLFSRTPLSYFFDGNILAVVVTAANEPVNGRCSPNQFLCVAENKCIYEGYRCDNINNCGDNSDEYKLGTSTCFMPQSSLLLISFGVINLIITWLSVFYCCVKSALSRKKALRDDRFGSATPPMGTGSVSGGDGATAQDVSADDDGSPDMMTSGPLRSEGASRAGGSSIRDPLVASVKKRDRDDTSSVGAN
ncbi:uncharacterized protein [Dermacentor albipictus]|uniref:uncharacterized protein isoform X1 n=1 Tax=Dermacentor albipictus TaxID=60249 RepID=UPI0038FC7FDA